MCVREREREKEKQSIREKYKEIRRDTKKETEKKLVNFGIRHFFALCLLKKTEAACKLKNLGN